MLLSLNARRLLMKKLILILLLLSLVISSSAFGASARWQALGNEQRFVIDTSNYGPYPARIHQFTNAVWLIPKPAFGDNDISAGILLKMKDNMTGAFHFNLPPSPGVSRLTSTLKSYGQVGDKPATNPRLAALEPRIFPDLFWAMKSGSMTVAGRLALAMDKSGKSAPKEVSTSARAIDANAGVTMATPLGDLDLGVGVGLQSFSDDGESKVIESTGGYLVSFDARLNKPKGKMYTLVPIFNVGLGANPVESGTTEISYMGGDLGLGLRAMFDKKMVVTGLVLGLNSVTKTPPKGDETTDTTLSAKFVAGCEAPLTKWLVVRGGANATLESNGNDDSSMDTKYYYNTGIRMMYGGFIVDIIFARDLFYRGPYLISGANKEGTNLGTNICITYAF